LDQIASSKGKIGGLSKSVFISCIVDCSYIESFAKERLGKDVKKNALVSIYETGEDTITLLKKFGIDVSSDRILDKTTLFLLPHEMMLLNNRAPYLISMALSDLSKYTKDDFSKGKASPRYIPDPGNEPVIGVIDTLFDTNVYFSKWVEYENTVSEDIPKSDDAFDHGTMVSSIIVDGPALNPNLDDGCGRFRVKHFGVMANHEGSSFTILKTIRRIVSENQDIKVWNLSLGTNEEIPLNYISPEAAILDKIQSKNDVTFIIAGTNKTFEDLGEKKIGAPADSINSIVVNAVDFTDRPASYTRTGPVLSFYNKPDLCFYGGDGNQQLTAFGPQGDCSVVGTSYAAPWIARKMAYLVSVMGLKREVAKAMLIDAAAGWMQKKDPSTKIGYGVVPIKIEDILHSRDDEIRFILMGSLEKYSTYNYNIPVPIVNEKHPYAARATLCYFPKCERNQGVDYTSSEVNLQFGRITKDGLKSVNGNAQDSKELPSLFELTEENVRQNYRKWDNVKYIAEKGYGKLQAKKAYANGSWGIKFTTKNRLKTSDGKDLHFGVVVTLKEINGKNRINEFIQQCSLRGWLVNHVNVESLVDVYNKAEETVEWR